jgi:hypothetical protein
MLMNLETFGRRISFDREALINELAAKTHRNTPAEVASWRSSLPTLWDALRHESLRQFHLHLGRRGDIVVEYRLPALSFWADAVLLGRGPSGPTAVVIELKDWKTNGDRPGPRPALISRPFGDCMHPSDQVQGYVEFCRRFHSAVQATRASVSGCVYFTLASDVSAYCGAPHEHLTREFPVFGQNEVDVNESFPDFVRQWLTEPDEEFARAFDAGTYKQDRTLVRQVAAAIKRPSVSPFVLIDKQREGYELCMARIDAHLKPAMKSARTSTGKSVIVIEGPPGSGKSIIAAHLWAQLGMDERVAGNIVLATTCSAQRTNWEELFSRTLGSRVARGMVIGSNRYNPGLNQKWLKRMREAGKSVTVESWRDNLALFRKSDDPKRCLDDSFAVSIVDEAHALIDPSTDGRRGMSPSGWMIHAGPQAWHVIRGSRVSVFLLDPEQSYRDNETTSVEQIQRFAAEQGADFSYISLAGSQFRCGGAVEYMDWVDALLDTSGSRGHSSKGQAARSRWRTRNSGPLEFEVYDDPQALEDALRDRMTQGSSARLVASYARPWRTSKLVHPHTAAAEAKDFQIRYRRADKEYLWTRIWNYAPQADYSLFIQASDGSPMSKDPLCEVGCPYVLRGFDFHYVGLLWLSDLVWRDKSWKVNLDHVCESAWRLPLSAARRGKGLVKERGTAEVIRRLQRGYRILLSRAMQGTLVWFEDEETRAHVESMLT